MYELLRNEFITNLDASFTRDQLSHILTALDAAASHYNIEKNNELMVIDHTADHIVKSYLVCKKIEGLSELTLQNYGRTLDNFFRAVCKPIDTITANDVRVYLFQYKSDRGITDRSLDKLRQYICSFFKWAAVEGYIAVDPVAQLKPIRYETKQRHSMTQEQLEYIRRSCKDIRESAIVEFLCSTWCRVSELTYIKRSDVDLNTGAVLLFGKGRKERRGFLNAKALVTLREYLDTRTDDDEHLFVTSRRPYVGMTSRSIEDIVAKLAERANVDGVTPHIFRHTGATQALHSGMGVPVIQKLLGHANIATTMIYAEVDDTSLRADHAKYVV